MIHWHTREPDLCTDEDIFFQQFHGLYENYKTLRSQKQPSDAEEIRLSVKDIIRQAFLLLIYNRLRYRPCEKTGLRILWKLCMYAEPEIKTFSPVTRNRPFDFFKFLEQAENTEEHTMCGDENVFGIVDRALESFMELKIIKNI
ncbi:hypothetical protein [Chryseobacterium hagamense]|uniref:hypothetical protein n=1 Tax=Chryseobacterium hagamense TaxID=395935 RepID=UPI0011BD7ADE|nr:hypothetical protein [Chryseobacterium hagamense]